MKTRGYGSALKPRSRKEDIRFNPELARRVGATMRQTRARLEVSQMRLAECSGVTRSQLSNIEAGRCLPSLALLYRLADALAILPKDLLP